MKQVPERRTVLTLPFPFENLWVQPFSLYSGYSAGLPPLGPFGFVLGKGEAPHL